MRKHIIIGIIVFIGIIIGFNNNSYASSHYFHSIDFVVNINKDGSMEVTETWNMTINKASTATKEFNLDKTKFGEIKDVSVKEISQAGQEIPFENIYMEMTKVTPNCYYALINSNNNFEIALGTGLENSSGRKIYKISYTVTDVVKTYNDCNELCWKFIGTNHKSKIDKVTGNIYLPEEVKNVKNLRGWAHGNLNGKININKGKVSFEVTDLYEDESLEVRIAVLEDMFYLNTNRIYMNNFDNILNEEQKYAEEANLKRKTSQESALLIQVLAIVILGFFVKNLKNRIKKEKTELSKISIIEPTEKYQYFRELPSENLTAGDIGFIYYYKTGKFRKELGKIFSADILSLYLKKYINMSKNENGNLTIRINKKANNKELKRDEIEVLNILTSASRNLKSTFTMKDFKRYINSMNRKKMFDKFFSIENSIENNARNSKIYAISNDKKRGDYKSQLWKSCLTLVLVFLITFSLLDFKVNFKINTILTVLLMAYVVLGLLNINNIKKLILRYSQLSQKGTDYYEKIQGLKRYIEDYSFIKEKEATDIVVWRDYLVCAVVLGISKKAIKEIFEQIPDFGEDGIPYSYFDYFYMDTLKVSNAVNNIQRYKDTVNSNYSSGEGFGGGFSDGDAGGGRRWKPWCEIE